MAPLNPSHEPSNSSASPSVVDREEISKECQQCISYLKNALNQPGRTQSLLRALGVVGPSLGNAVDAQVANTVGSNSINTTNKDVQNTRIYQPTPDGRGVVLHLNSKHGINSPVLMDKIQPRVSLQKRLTNAASRMVYGAKPNGSTNNDGGAVLTTSPSTNMEEMQQMAKQEMPKETTITIECMKCGSDTRAEAGGK